MVGNSEGIPKKKYCKLKGVKVSVYWNDDDPQLCKIYSRVFGTAKRQSHPSPSLFRLPNAIVGFNMSSLCHLFWLRPLYSLDSKVFKNLPFFITSVQSAWEGAERSSVLSHIFAALCNVLAAPRLIEPKQLKLSLDMSNLHVRAATRVVLQSSLAQHFPMDSRIGYWTLNSASRTISSAISLSSLRLRPLYSRTPPDSKFFKFSLDQSNLHGKEQKEAVFCLTFLQHFTMYSRHGD